MRYDSRQPWAVTTSMCEQTMGQADPQEGRSTQDIKAELTQLKQAAKKKKGQVIYMIEEALFARRTLHMHRDAFEELWSQRSDLLNTGKGLTILRTEKLHPLKADIGRIIARMESQRAVYLGETLLPSDARLFHLLVD